MTDRLKALVDEIRDYQMTAHEVAEQRIAFAYGNAPIDEKSTKEQVREAVYSVSAPATSR